MISWHAASDERGDFIAATCAFGRLFLLDAADVHLLGEHRWKTMRSRKGTCYVWRKGLAGETKVVLLHREIMSAPPELQVDHRDWRGLNNRRYNLRLVTQKQNMTYVRPDAKRRGSVPVSGKRGVYRTESGRWSALITIDKKQHYLGTFGSVDEAAAAWDVAAIAARGVDHTYLNNAVNQH